MKTIAAAAFTVLLGSMAFAQGAAPSAKPETSVKKVSYKEAKGECKHENKALKGAELKKCIEGKQGK